MSSQQAQAGLCAALLAYQTGKIAVPRIDAQRHAPMPNESEKMALINCADCGTPISKEADTCPKCGGKPRKSVGVVGKTIAVLFLVVLVKSIYSSSVAPKVVAPPVITSTTTSAPISHDARSETMRQGMAALEANMAAMSTEKEPMKKSANTQKHKKPESVANKLPADIQSELDAAVAESIAETKRKRSRVPANQP